MKISASKLIANRANATRSTGPRSIEGKRISSENAQRHGFASSAGVSVDLGSAALASMVEEARGFGFSVFEAEDLVTRLAAARDVIDAKHVSFKEKPEAERMPNMSPEALYRTIKEMETPRSGLPLPSVGLCSRSCIDRLKKTMTEQGVSQKSSSVTESSCATSSAESIKSAKPPRSKNNKTNPKR